MRTRSAVACFLWVAGAALAGAQSKDTSRTAAFAGVVRDVKNVPVSMVTVVAEGKDLSEVTDDSGRFFVKGLPPGLNDFTIFRPGYKSVSFSATLSADSTLVVAIKLQFAQTLAAVNISAERVAAGLKRTGYYDRERLSIGSFVSPRKVDSLADYVMHPSELLRGLRGIDVQCGAGGCTVHTMRAPDCLWVFVDGNYLPSEPGDPESEVDRIVPLGEVAAIEVYEKASIVPTEFQGRLPKKRNMFTVRAGCGALVVWTKPRVANQKGR